MSRNRGRRREAMGEPFRLQRRAEPVMEEMVAVAEGGREPRQLHVSAPEAPPAGPDPVAAGANGAIAPFAGGEDGMPEGLAKRVFALVAEFGAPAVAAAIGQHSPPLIAWKAPPAPEAERLAEQLQAIAADCPSLAVMPLHEMAAVHTRPLFPDHVFPVHVVPLDVNKTRPPLRELEIAVAREVNDGQATVVYETNDRGQVVRTPLACGRPSRTSCADGSVRFLRNTVAPQTGCAPGSRDGIEVSGADAYHSHLRAGEPQLPCDDGLGPDPGLHRRANLTGPGRPLARRTPSPTARLTYPARTTVATRRRRPPARRGRGADALRHFPGNNGQDRVE
jgi:hypothetical protein